MGSIRCTVKEYNRFVGPRIRNSIQNLTRPRKRQLRGVCELCHRRARELDAAHKTGKSRVQVIARVLREFQLDDGTVKGDLQVIESRILADHLPVDKTMLMLCRKCHRTYGT